MTKVDKKAYVERLAEEAQEAARRQDLKTLYRITKTLSGRFINSDVPVKDKDIIITNKGDIDRTRERTFSDYSEQTRTVCNSRYTSSKRGRGYQHRNDKRRRGESSDQVK